MNHYQTLLQRLQNGDRILIDGATGTEIERRGVPMVDNAWNGGGALTHPDIVRQVHEDYIRCLAGGRRSTGNRRHCPARCIHLPGHSRTGRY